MGATILQHMSHKVPLTTQLCLATLFGRIESQTFSDLLHRHIFIPSCFLAVELLIHAPATLHTIGHPPATLCTPKFQLDAQSGAAASPPHVSVFPRLPRLLVHAESNVSATGGFLAIEVIR
ncbi:hypothetical protein E2C01_065151 [Portunus trituberculatus]|uniref:Uncharacterized protein n=1 Tax=Portunus trituberculatus TaxID=210409 RepID=A0A5B7HM89_PORTR|nr:hypothetical protein [Portunus trituberculatus]